MAILRKAFLAEIQECSQKISELVERRNAIIEQHQNELKHSICKMMDWENSEIFSFKVKYGSLEKRIMAEVTIRWDSRARYVFAIGLSGNPTLQFRELIDE